MSQPIDPTKILDDAEAIRRDLRETVAREKALRVLLRAAAARERELRRAGGVPLSLNDREDGNA
jgi:hypothetical protein